MNNKATAAGVFYPMKGDMYHLKSGFLMIEILISLAMITGFVVMCMRHQAQSLALQAQAIQTMEVIDRIEGILDNVKNHKSLQEFSNCKYNCATAVAPVTVPLVQGSLPNFSLTSIQHMKIMTVTISWASPSGQQTCRLPVVFKEGIYGGS